MEFRCSPSMSLSVFNSGGTLVVADPASLGFLIFTETPGKLVIMKDGVCTEKTYRTSGAGTTAIRSRQMSDEECKAVRRMASEELEKNRVYWDKWGKDFNKNMQDSFPPGFPFHNQQQNFGPGFPFQNQQQNSGPSTFSGNFFKDIGSNMQKTFFSGFPFRFKK